MSDIVETENTSTDRSVEKTGGAKKKTAGKKKAAGKTKTAKKRSGTLVIVESPAKAKTIEKYLGGSYTVLASMGHLIDLPKSRLGINIEENFEPEYLTIRGKAKLLKELQKAAKKNRTVLLASDPDREGEAISFHIRNALLSKDRSWTYADRVQRDHAAGDTGGGGKSP